MTAVEEEIRKTAAGLLSEGKVDVVIGFAAGSLPMRAAPCFITGPEDAQQLVWNSYCLNNLAVYLPGYFIPAPHSREDKPAPKVAIVVKGCDGRSVVGLIKEKQIPRDNLIIIAAPC